MGDDWEEIRRLAGDLQRAQLSGSMQKLSERNCIEIVSLLVSMNLLNVLYTADGKEYLTPEQLCREIKNELYVNGGRITLADLASTLNVDYSHAETQASNVAESDPRIYLVLGQLVHSDYLDGIAEQVNETLQQKGSISISTITKEFDLPPDFLQDEIVKRLGSIIEGFQDENNPKEILTPTQVSRTRAKIRGVLSGVTVPTTFSSIIQKFGFQERLSFSLAEELINSGRLRGSFVGGKKAGKAIYVPFLYAKAQRDWVDNFLSQNGYLEYDALERLGISEPITFIKKRYPDEDLTFLASCCVGGVIRDQMEASMDEVLSTGSWIDFRPLLPSILGIEDGSQLITAALKPGCLIFCDLVVVSQEYLEKLLVPFKELMTIKAREDVDSGKVAQLMIHLTKGGKLDGSSTEGFDKKEERRKKAVSGKTGGGVQGRETKTKSTKKKYRSSKNVDVEVDDEIDHNRSSSKLEFISVKEIEEKLMTLSSLHDCPEDLPRELARHLYPDLSESYSNLVMKLYQSTVTASLQTKRKTLGDLEEKANTMINSIRLFGKGVHVFDEFDDFEEIKDALEKYLLKTLCNDLVNEFLLVVASDHGIPNLPDQISNPEQRLKIMNNLPPENGEALLKIHKAVLGKNVNNFVSTFEENSDPAAGILIKSKPDKKKDRQIVFNHRQNLMEQLNQSNDDPAVILNLVALILFQVITGQMLHASGKFIPKILAFVSKSLSPEVTELLLKYQDLVIRLLKIKSDHEDEEKSEIKKNLESMTGSVKRVPLDFKEKSK